MRFIPEGVDLHTHYVQTLAQRGPVGFLCAPTVRGTLATPSGIQADATVPLSPEEDAELRALPDRVARRIEREAQTPEPVNGLPPAQPER